MMENTKEYLKRKIRVASLPTSETYQLERRIINDQGEMAQILCSETAKVKHILYWDLRNQSGKNTRGAHYHAKKIENSYVIKGKLQFYAKDNQTGEDITIELTAGDKITVYPNVFHIYTAMEYCQLIEFMETVYDPQDTFKPQY